MKNYTKVHSTQEIADIHLARIKKRGGTGTTKKVVGGIQIDYQFPEKEAGKDTGKPAKKTKRYDVISPDGFTIRLGDQDLFKDPMEARAYFLKWRTRFERQGYYSSNNGRIKLEDLLGACELKVIE